MRKRCVLYSLTVICGSCQMQKNYIGEDESGQIRQAKINARIAAAEDGWYVNFYPGGDLCQTCKILPEADKFIQ